LSDFAPETRFSPVLSVYNEASISKVERVVFLSGKLYYDLAKTAETRGLAERVVFVRLEELCPFPFKEVASIVKKLSSAKQFLWVQEEARNQGAWSHVEQRFSSVMTSLGMGKTVEYRGRPVSAVPAIGTGRLHTLEHASVLDQAFEGL